MAFRDHLRPRFRLVAFVAAFGLAAAFAAPHGMQPTPLGYLLHGLAYLAGAWFAVGEVWERLRKATLDVHFLMLAVAAGAAAPGRPPGKTVALAGRAGFVELGPLLDPARGVVDFANASA